ERLPRVSPRGRQDVRVEGARRLDCILRLRGHDEPVQTEGEAGLRDPLSPEDLGEVVRASSADLFLRAEIRGVDLEDHAGVVIEAAYDPHVERVILSGDSIGIEEIGDFLEVLESRAPRTLEDSCGLVEDRSVPRELAE